MKKYKIDRNEDADLFSCGNEKAIGIDFKIGDLIDNYLFQSKIPL